MARKLMEFIGADETLRAIQIGSKDSQIKTQLVLWIFILFKVKR
jgi:hypothetical protein